MFLGSFVLFFPGPVFYSFLVDFRLLDSVSFYPDFIVGLGGSGVLSSGADYFYNISSGQNLHVWNITCIWTQGGST